MTVVRSGLENCGLLRSGQLLRVNADPGGWTQIFESVRRLMDTCHVSKNKFQIQVLGGFFDCQLIYPFYPNASSVALKQSVFRLRGMP